MESFVRAAILLSCVSSILAGCRHENDSSNYRSLWISSNSGVLYFSSELKKNTALTTYLSFTFTSLSEKDSSGAEILSHSLCYNCENKNVSEEHWLMDPGFQTCINEETAKTASSTSFSVIIENWEWCDYCGNAEENDTQKGNFLDVVLIAESFTDTEMMALTEDDDHISFGDYSIKFTNLYSTEESRNQMMPSGFPTIIQLGLKTYITLRLQRQGNLGTYTYQPLIVKQETPLNSPSPGAVPKGGQDGHISSIVIAVIIFSLVTIPISFWCYTHWLDKGGPEEKLFPPMTSGMKNHYASLDDSEVFGNELEHVELQHGAREIELPETEGEDCLSDSRGEEDPEQQADRSS